MAKFTDAVRNTLQGYFNAGDQPTEAEFAELISDIQQGIEEHQHDGTGDGDGTADIGPISNILVYEAAAIASVTVESDGDRARLILDCTATSQGEIYFQENGGLNFAISDIAGAQLGVYDGSIAGWHTVFEAGGDVGIGVGLAPAYRLDVKDDQAAGFTAHFFNDGDNVDRYVLLLQGGADNGAAVGTTEYIYALDGDGHVTGSLRTIDGVFQITDLSDEGLKTNIQNTRLKGLDIINGLRVRDFNWKSNPKGPVMTSFIAQEAREVYPTMVSEALDGTLMTSKGLLIPILTKAIQELDARLTKLGG